MKLKLFFIAALFGCMMSASAQERFLLWYDYCGTKKIFVPKETYGTYFIIGASEFTQVLYIDNGATRRDIKYKMSSVQNDGSVVYRRQWDSHLKEFIVWPDKNVVLERDHYNTRESITLWLKESEWEKYPHNESDYKSSKYNGVYD